MAIFDVKEPPDNALILSIPMYVRDKILSIGHIVGFYDYKFTSESKQWFDSEIKNDFGFWKRPVKIGVYHYCIWFTDEKDAILFKMRWF
jgi:hypothetical protein